VGGLQLWSGLLWMVPVTLGIFATYYASIVGWEEALLAERFGAEYVRYCRETPRWWPRLDRLGSAIASSALHGWRDVGFSERGTLIAIVVGGTLLALRHRFLL